MKRKLNIKLLLLLTVMVAFWSVNAVAQDDKSDKKSKTKIVIVKKIKDKNGEVRVERIEKTGDEAKAYLKERKLDKLDDKLKDVDVRINIESDNKDKKIEVIEIDDLDDLSDEIKLKLKDLDIDLNMDMNELDGEFEVIEVNPSVRVKRFGPGHGGISIKATDKIKDKVKNLNINVNDDSHTVEIEMKDGTKKKFEWEGKIPDETRKALEEMGFEVSDKKMHQHQGMRMRVNTGKSHDRVMVKPSDKVKDDIKTIDVQVDGDTKTINVTMKNGEKQTFEWTGEMPDDVRKSMEEAGLTVQNGGSGNNFWVTDGKPKPFLGVKMGEAKSDLGVAIDGVVEGSAAEEAGLQKGDILTAINGTSVKKFGDLVKVLEDMKVGDKAEISYIRGENTAKTTATLKEGKGGAHFIEKIGGDNEFFFEGNDFDFEGMGENLQFKSESRVILGIYTDDSHDGDGVKIKGLTEGSGAEKAGLQKGDVILSIDGKTTNKVKNIGEALDGKKADDKVEVVYTRDGKKANATVALTKSKGETVLFFKHKDGDDHNLFEKKRNEKNHHHQV